MNSQPMRQYVNQSESGTVTQTSMGPSPIEAVTERVMMIAQRLVACENVVKQQAATIKTQGEEIEALKTKIENIALKASGKEFKKPTTTRAKKPNPPTDTTAA